MDNTPTYLDMILDLEARHDDLLQRLEELDQRVEDVLTEWMGNRELAALPRAAARG